MATLTLKKKIITNSKKQLDLLKPLIKEWLKANVSKKRFEHITRVALTARKYAKFLKLDFNKAELSGWLHDSAKEFKNEKLLQIAKLKKIPLDEIDLINPHILHARVGAEIAKDRFAVYDPDVLGGIRCHTLAEPYMTKISMVVYLADATEPGRDKKKSAPIKKKLRQKGLECAVLEALDNKLKYVLEKGGVIHPLTINARNWLILEIKNGKKKN